MLKAFKYRLYPTKPQLQDLQKTLTLCRQLYNAALQERRDAYKKAGKTVGFYEQKRHLPKIRAELPEYKSIHSQVLQNVIERVDKAFQGFFRRVKQGQTPGYPRFKGEGALRQLHLPPGQPNRGQGAGRGQAGAHLRGRLGQMQAPPPPGRQAQNRHGQAGARYFQKSQAKLACAQRDLARKKRGSRRREQARGRVAKLHRKVANQRKDFHHKLARRLVNRYGTIVPEHPRPSPQPHR